ncbi:hypothetical protein CO661_04820 [Sinorhizobium fredii]|uniref:Uncharacterized protein n=1 Tax=Rhizobium fredii TaxID=380 RepID=A0A2A6M3H4_RHIFR|nr:hypothetical protein CO661_04820 [Sinorhizobium fredii]
MCLIRTELHTRGNTPMSKADLWIILWVISSLAFGVCIALLTRRR